MSYRMVTVRGYEIMEGFDEMDAKNDLLNDDVAMQCSKGRVVNICEERERQETINAFKKILNKEIIFD